MLQIAIVAVIVTLCFGYAGWTLMPAPARKSIASALLARPLPGFLADRLRPYATDASGCGCDGCDRAAEPKAAKPVAATITFHPRRQR